MRFHQQKGPQRSAPWRKLALSSYVTRIHWSTFQWSPAVNDASVPNSTRWTNKVNLPSSVDVLVSVFNW